MTTVKNKMLHKIKHQGAPIVNSSSVVLERDDIVCIELDLKTKYCEVSCTTDDGIYISPTERTLDTKSDINIDSSSTKVMFPKYKEWSFYASNNGRYTISIVLIKK